MDENGKWSCGDCFFSLSHSRRAVAVAVSRKPVGVDIESLDRPMSAGLPGKILTAAEQAEYAALPEDSRLSYLLQAWCAKESLFKVGEDKQFRPTALDTAGVRTGTVTVSGHPYCYAVATDTPEKLRIYENVQL
jgi:phosphopantetheinyl transferase